MTRLADPTERVAVLRTDLERWLELMHYAHGHLMATDLAQNYREGRPDKQYSKLTRMAAQAHDRIDAYLEGDHEPLSTD